MICNKCSTQNEENSKFCENCGNPLVDGMTAAMPAISEDDLPPMRPYTKMAYAIYDSEKRGLIKLILYIVFIALCVGMVAVVAELISTWDTLSVSLGSSFREVQIQSVETVRNAVGADSGKTIILLILALVLIIFAYILLGRFLLRLKKVERYERTMQKKRRTEERVEALRSGRDTDIPAIESGKNK